MPGSGFRNITVFLTANVTGISAGIAKAEAELKGLAVSTVGSAQSAAKGLASLNAQQKQSLRTVSTWSLAVGGVMVGAIGLATLEAAKLERSMRNVQTIMLDDSGQKLTSEGFQQVTDSILQMSTTVPQSADQLAKGLYDVVSAGFQGSQALTILHTAALAASAGLTDTSTAATAIITVLNAYGLAAGDAAMVSNVLFQSVNLGIYTFSQLADNIGEFVGSARAAHVDIVQANAALATLTRNGIQASEAGISLNRVIQAFLQPSVEMTKVLKSMGYESGLAALHAEGLQGIMSHLSGVVGDNATEWLTLFQDIRGARGALALTAGGGRQYADVLKQMSDTTVIASATQRAYNEQAKGAAFQTQLAKNQIMASAIGIGQTFLPVVVTLAHALGAVAAGFGSLPAPVRTVITFVFLATGATLLLGGALTKLSLSLATTVTSLATMAGASAGTQSALLGITKFAGPAAIALTVLTFVIGQQAQRHAEAKALSEQYAQAIQAEGDANGQAAKQVAIAELAKRGLIDTARRLGVSIKDLVDASLGDEAAMKRVATQAKATGSAHDFAGKQVEGFKRGIQGAFGSASVNDYEKLTKGVKKLAGAHDEGAKTARQQAAAQKEAGVEIGVASGPTSELAGQLAQLDAAQQGAAGSAFQLTDAEKAMQQTIGGLTGVDTAWAAIVARKQEAAQQTKKAASGGKDEAQRANDIASAQLGIERAVLRVADAQDALDKARQPAAADALAIAQAERSVQEAYDGVRQAVFAVLDAERALEDARRRQTAGRSVEEASIAYQRALDGQASAAADVTQAQLKLAAAQDHGTPVELAQSERELSEQLRRQKEAAWAVEDAQVALNRARQDQASGRGVVEAELGIASAQRGAAAAGDQVVTATRSLQDARKTDDSGRAIKNAELDLREALLGVRQAQESLVQAQKPEQDALDTTSTKVGDVTVSLQELRAEMLKNVRAAIDFSDNLTWIAQHGGPPGMVEALQKMGDKGVIIAADLRGKMPPELRSMFDVMVADAVVKTDEWQRWVTVKTQGGSEAANYWTAQMVAGMANTLGIAPEDAKRILADYLNVLGTATLAAFKAFGKGRAPTDPAILQEFAGSVGALGGRPTFIAKGGIVEDHVAQVAPAGAWRVWAEPETGGEAYIPRFGDKKRAMSTLVQAASWYGADVSGYAAGGVAPPPYDAMSALPAYAAVPGDAAADVVQRAARAYLAAILAQPAALGPAGPAGPVPPGAPRDWILAGLALAGVDAGWLPGMYRLAQAESGLDPRAWNPISVGGEHATGFMQMLGSTFRAHMVPGHGDIYNPIDNVASSAGYIGGRYGTVYNTPLFKGGKYVGYGHGGIVSMLDHLLAARGGILAQVLDGGGYLPTGWSLAGNFTGRPEPVGRGLGGITIRYDHTVQINAPVYGVDDLERRIAASGERAKVELVDFLEREVARR